MGERIRTKVFDFFICSLGFFVMLNIVSWVVVALGTDSFLPDWRYFFFPAHFWFLPATPHNIIPLISIYGWMLSARLTNENNGARFFFIIGSLAITGLTLLALTSQSITIPEKILVARDVILGFCVPVFLLIND